MLKRPMNVESVNLHNLLSSPPSPATTSPESSAHLHLEQKFRNDASSPPSNTINQPAYLHKKRKRHAFHCFAPKTSPWIVPVLQTNGRCFTKVSADLSAELPRTSIMPLQAGHWVMAVKTGTVIMPKRPPQRRRRSVYHLTIWVSWQDLQPHPNRMVLVDTQTRLMGLPYMPIN